MIGIIGAMGSEVASLRSSLKNTAISKRGGFRFYAGELEGKPAVILRCSVGTVNAAAGCTLMLNIYKPDFIINTGVAGGIGEKMRIGDVVISTGLQYYDADVTGFGFPLGQIPGQPRIFPADKRLIAQAEQAAQQLKAEKTLPETMNFYRGLIGSADIFMHDPRRIAKLKEQFPKIAAVEMEGAAIAHCCRLFSVPVLIIRSLSDIAGTKSPVALPVFLALAARRSAEIVRRIVKNSESLRK
jgi:adenosylhomocysteine nucleosidase